MSKINLKKRTESVVSDLIATVADPGATPEAVADPNPDEPEVATADDSVSEEPASVDQAVIPETPVEPETTAEVESDEIPFVSPVINPTPTKPTLDFEVMGDNGRSVRGRFVDESAAIGYFTDRHGASGAVAPSVVCHTEPRVASVYVPE